MAKLNRQQSLVQRSVVLWVMVTSLFAIAPHLTRMPLLLSVALVVLTGWRISHYYRNPHWLLRTFTVLCAVFIIFWLYQGLWGRLPGSQLLCCMLILKSLELNRTRDAMLMVTLSFFVVATWFLFSQSPVTFVYLVIATWLGLTTMIVINRGGSKQSEVRPMLKQGARLAIPAIPLALAMFFLFPRLSVPLWGIQGGELEGVTGLSSSMSPGDISNLFIDDGPAFRVTFNGPKPPKSELYWRGPVLTRFDGRRWSQSVYSSVLTRNEPKSNDTDIHYLVELEPHRRHWLFALDYASSYPEDARLGADYQLRSMRPISSVRRYSISSDMNFRNNRKLSRTLRNETLRIPDNNGQQARELVREWQTEDASPDALIQNALHYFRDNPFFYRLDALPLLEDPIDEFLFDSRVGYCEHYASAFTYLMRAAGIPARVVTGYQGGIDNGEYLLVRQSDAHAWAEVWLDDERGWTRVDPTSWVAPNRVQQGSRAVVDVPNWLHAPWLVDMRNQVDKIRHWWNKNIVSFNANRQSQLLKPWGIEKVDHRQLLLLLIILSIIFACIIFWWYRHTDHIQHKDPVVKAYHKLINRIRCAGIDTPIHAGPQTIMQTIIGYHPEMKLPVEQLFNRYIHYRYAVQPEAVGKQQQHLKTHPLVQNLKSFRLPKKR